MPQRADALISSVLCPTQRIRQKPVSFNEQSVQISRARERHLLTNFQTTCKVAESSGIFFEFLSSLRY